MLEDRKKMDHPVVASRTTEDKLVELAASVLASNGSRIKAIKTRRPF